MKTLENYIKNNYDKIAYLKGCNPLKLEGTTKALLKILEWRKEGQLPENICNYSIKQYHDVVAKLTSVQFNDYFTSDDNSKYVADLILEYHDGKSEILDMGSGIGQITKYLGSFGLGLEWQNDYNKINTEYNKVKCEYANFFDIKDEHKNRFKFACGNPPFCREFNKEYLKWLIEVTTQDVICVMILPLEYGKTLEKFGFKIIREVSINEEFYNTKIKTKIFIFKKK